MKRPPERSDVILPSNALTEVIVPRACLEKECSKLATALCNAAKLMGSVDEADRNVVVVQAKRLGERACRCDIATMPYNYTARSAIRAARAAGAEDVLFGEAWRDLNA